jgi:hypothetical protein
LKRQNHLALFTEELLSLLTLELFPGKPKVDMCNEKWTTYDNWITVMFASRRLDIHLHHHYFHLDQVWLWDEPKDPKMH